MQAKLLCFFGDLRNFRLLALGFLLCRRASQERCWNGQGCNVSGWEVHVLFPEKCSENPSLCDHSRHTHAHDECMSVCLYVCMYVCTDLHTRTCEIDGKQPHTIGQKHVGTHQHAVKGCSNVREMAVHSVATYDSSWSPQNMTDNCRCLLFAQGSLCACNNRHTLHDVTVYSIFKLLEDAIDSRMLPVISSWVLLKIASNLSLRLSINSQSLGLFSK